jgi:hypothetical protein
LVGELGLGDRGLALQRQRVAGADGVQATVDFGVDPADEERRHAVHRRQVAASLGEGLEPG